MRDSETALDLLNLSPADAAARARHELRLRHAEGILHNINSVIQIVSGQVALLQRQLPDEPRCEKIIKGVDRITTVAKTLLATRCDAGDARGVVSETLVHFNALCSGSERRKLSLSGKTFEIDGAQSMLFEAFIMLSLEDLEDGGDAKVSFDPKKRVVRCAAWKVPLDENPLITAMDAAGISLESGTRDGLALQFADSIAEANEAFEG